MLLKLERWLRYSHYIALYYISVVVCSNKFYYNIYILDIIFILDNAQNKNRFLNLYIRPRLLFSKNTVLSSSIRWPPRINKMHCLMSKGY